MTCTRMGSGKPRQRAEPVRPDPQSRAREKDWNMDRHRWSSPAQVVRQRFWTAEQL